MKYIKLATGENCLVDLVDYDYLNQYSWNRQRNLKRNKTDYAVTQGCKRTISMHMMVAIRANIKVTGTLDHINHNTLDNRRHNLRAATQSEQSMNTGPRCNSKSGYKGVYYHTKYTTKPWVAAISKNGKKYCLGNFKTLKEAVIAYNNKAEELYGDFAWLNPLPLA
jgi:hypothetical protein